MTTSNPRDDPRPAAPGWIPADVTAANRTLDTRLRRIAHMDLRRWKLIRNTVLSIAIFGFAAWAIMEGAPTGPTALFALLIVATLNGIDMAELAAVYAEVKTGQSPRDDDTD
jgi:hypothetical protein